METIVTALLRTLALLSALAGCGAAQAQTGANFPLRTVTFVVPYTQGVSIDNIARILAARLSERWKQPVVVENKPGASGIIGTEFVARAAPDGHVLLVTVNTFAMAPALFKKLPFDPVADFAPVGRVAVSSYALAVNPERLPAKDFAEFLSLVKAKPGQLNYGTPGNGTPHHLAMELMKQREALDIVHVPYKGAAGAITDLLGGQVQMMIAPVPTLLPHARSGKIRFLAVTGERAAQAPDVPAFREFGMDYMDAVDSWFALLAPGRTPPALLQRLNQDLRVVMEIAEVRETLLKQGLRPSVSSTEEFAAQIRSDLARWVKVVADGKISAD
jgi:tripartite-type tricarboxylate transporter receptor subunit TctC